MLDFMVKLQEFRTPFLNKAIEFITITAEETFIIVVMCIIFWCINREHGYKLILSIVLATISNSALKMLLNVARPWVKDDRIIPIRQETATSSSMPSGHTQVGSTMWFSISISFKKKVLSIISYVMIILIALSRVYLGVHTPQDVLVALILSIIGVFIAHRLVDIALKKNSAFVFMIVALIACTGLPFFIDETYYKMTGLVISLPLAFFLENKYIVFQAKATFYKQILKILIGVIVVLVFKEGLKLILPETLIFTTIRYIFIGISAIYLVPLIFVSLKLSKRKS